MEIDLQQMPPLSQELISDCMVTILKIQYDVTTPSPIVRSLRNLEDRRKMTCR